MGIIFDLIFISIIVITAVVSAKRGFVRTLLELVGFIAAVAIALSVSMPIAEYTYDNYIGPTVTSGMGDIIVENVSEMPENIWEELPASVQKITSAFGITSEQITGVVTPELEKGASNVTDIISQKILRPALLSLISAILNILLILILVPIFRLIARFINKLFSFSLVGTLNKGLGAVLGVLKGAVFCVILSLVLNLIFGIAPDGVSVINAENLNKSVIFSFIKPFI